jgi:hypothetical protein
MKPIVVEIYPSTADAFARSRRPTEGANPQHTGEAASMTDSDTNLRELILAKIDDLLAHDHDSSFADASEELLQRIAGARTSLIAGEADFLRGYLLYLQPETKRAVARVHEIRSLLLRALSASSDKSLAGRTELYLGHIAYDVASYAEAAAHFREAQRHDLSAFLQAKSSEMLVCCAPRLDGAAAALPELTSFVTLIEKMAAQDIWPSEPPSCVATRGSRT